MENLRCKVNDFLNKKNQVGFAYKCSPLFDCRGYAPRMKFKCGDVLKVVNEDQFDPPEVYFLRVVSNNQNFTTTEMFVGNRLTPFDARSYEHDMIFFESKIIRIPSHHDKWQEDENYAD